MPNLKIQFFNGGLANQAFQYIFARYYEFAYPGRIMYLDDSWFALHTVHNGYELEKVFGIKPHMLSEAFDADVWEYMLEEKRQGKSIPQILKDNDTDISMITEMLDPAGFNPFDGNTYIVEISKYCPNILNFDEDIYYHGYWLNKGWFDTFRRRFLKEFQFPALSDDYNRKLMRRILNKPSASIHIRRGDYVNLNIALEAAKYKEIVDACIKEGGGDAALYVFSDDINWCRQNCEEIGLNRFKDLVYVEGNSGGKNYIDMQLMTNCEIMMIGNSSFAFLATLLNQRRKLVINASGRDI